MKSGVYAGIGSGIGIGVGTYLGLSKSKKLKSELRKKHPSWTSDQIQSEYNKLRKRSILKHAAIGGAAGAVTGLGVKHLNTNLKSKYNKYVGAPQSNVNINHFAKGDVIAYDRGGYEHYGIVVDNKGNSIEYTRHDSDPNKAAVVKTNITTSAGTSKVRKVPVKAKFTPDEIVSRAEKYVGSNLGGYNLTNNNCEHFVRHIVENDKKSTQVINAVKKSPITRLIVDYSKSRYKNKVFAKKELADHVKSIGSSYAMDMLHDVRKRLPNEVGGLSHFNKYQTPYLTGVGATLGGVIGYKLGNRKLKKLASEHNLKKDSLEYKLLKRDLHKTGISTGAILGAGVGYGTSKGMDGLRGKVIKDKIKNTYGVYLDTNNKRIGRAFRGINSSDQANRHISNWKTLYHQQIQTLI